MDQKKFNGFASQLLDTGKRNLRINLSYKSITLLFVVSVAFILLIGCQLEGDGEMSQKAVERGALEYLEDRYSADFNILQVQENIVGAGPIFSFRKKPTYWEVLAESSQFPGETITLVRTTSGSWRDNYYSLLLNDEAVMLVNNIVENEISSDYYIYVVWGLDDWPKGTTEGISFKEWIKAGGTINKIIIYLRDCDLEDEWSKDLAEEIHENIPTVQFVVFLGLTDEGFTQLISDVKTFTISQKWILKRLSYDWFTE